MGVVPTQLMIQRKIQCNAVAASSGVTISVLQNFQRLNLGFVLLVTNKTSINFKNTLIVSLSLYALL